MFAMFTYYLRLILNKIMKLFVPSVAVVRTKTILSLVREMTTTTILTVCKKKSTEFFYDVNKEKVSFALLYFENY
jgi:hypothetical protein